MRLICIEEYTVDPAPVAAAGPAMAREAPYLGGMGAGGHASAFGDGLPEVVELDAADAAGVDLGPGRLAVMDAHGVDTQVVSCTSPVQLAPADQAPALARAVNDRLAAAADAHPGRLAGFAALPWNDPRDAVAELDRAVGELGLRGVLIMNRPDQGFLDAPRHEPVLRRIAELGVPLYLHPSQPLTAVQQAYYTGFSDLVTAELSLGGWGWHHEAGVHLLRMLLAGVFDRIGDLQVISGHWGEMVPYFLSRLDRVLPRAKTGLSRTVSDTYRAHVWITPSGIFDAAHVAFAREVVGLDRVIWSVDHPFLTLDGTRPFLDGLALSDDERAAICHRNAEQLLGV